MESNGVYGDTIRWQSCFYLPSLTLLISLFDPQMPDLDRPRDPIAGPSYLTRAEAAQLLLSEDRDDLSEFFHDHTELAASTARTYRSSWEDFMAWCRSAGGEPFPAGPETIARYLEARSGLALSTLRNRLSAIRFVHGRFGWEDPTREAPVVQVEKRLSREKGREEERRSPIEDLEAGPYAPSDILRGGADVLEDYLSRVFEPGDPGVEEGASRREKRRRALQIWQDPVIGRVDVSPERLSDPQRRLVPEARFDLPVMRNRAVLILMAAGGLSRAEAQRADLLDVFVTRETNDDVDLDEYLTAGFGGEGPRGAGGFPQISVVCVGIRKKSGMPDRVLHLKEADRFRFCGARALTAWIVGAGLTAGALFRAFTSHGHLKDRRIAPSSINLLIQESAEEAGFDPDEWTPSRLADGL